MPSAPATIQSPSPSPSPSPSAEPEPALGEPAALVVSYTFDAGPAEGPAFDVRVRLSGHRMGVQRKTPADTFTRTETIAGVVPGSGRVAATAWVYDIAPGEWEVTADLLGPERMKRLSADLRLPRAGWSWRRWAIESGAPQPVGTRWALLAPLARTPAVIPGSFTLLASLGLVLAFAVQPLFLRSLGLDVASGIAASALGLVVGLMAAKAWYMVLKGPSRRTLLEGWSVDGFLVAAPLAALAASAAQGLAPAAYLDAATPGIFLAVAVGRVGCFLTGCCAGRMTSGRGIVSSDRRIVARRVPAQLFESGLGLVLAVATAGVVLGVPVAGSGLVFLVAIGGYVAARQWLLRQRAEARAFSWVRRPTSTVGTR